MNPIDRLKLHISRYINPRIDKRTNVPVGVQNEGKTITLYFQNQVTPQRLTLAKSDNGFDFLPLPETLTLPFDNPKINHLSNYSMGQATYIALQEKDADPTILFSSTRSLVEKERIDFTVDPFYIISDRRTPKARIMYYGNRSIRVAFSPRMKTWDHVEKPLLFGAKPLQIGGVWNRHDGILVLYFKKEIIRGITYHDAYLAFFDETQPDKLLWKLDEPIWRQKDQWKDEKCSYVGSVLEDDRLISYWYVNSAFVFAVVHSGFPYHLRSLTVQNKASLSKHESNPILAPQQKNDWEAFNTFNPAAVYAGGKVHILYRAQGYDYVSTVGYASSSDGVSIHERLDEPIFTPDHHLHGKKPTRANYDFMSGGSFGGCEDPRITLIDGRIYMSYVAFDGWSPPRLALTSLLLEDFLLKRWNWSKPVMVSRPGIVDKSGCILPEKINGKYVFFHRVFPNILIDYIDDLNFDGKTKWLKGEYQIPIRPNMWDSRKIGAGAPPLKTKDGWLLIYYGVDDKDASKYHIGAMLLDLKDPTHVLHRSNHPVLMPSEEYENNGFKPGIAYPCGAVIVKDELLVYYGGADSVVCVASAHLDTFLKQLTSSEEAKLKPVQVKEVAV